MANRELNEMMMSSEFAKISEEELKYWLKAELGSKWSERDLLILPEVLFKEYESINLLNKPLKNNRELYAKMLIRGKISKGIPLED